MKKSALILFAHGARDPRWALPFQRLQAITQTRLPSVRVELAFLELMIPSLPVLVEKLVQQGVTEITIAPIFLGQGGHVLRDLPALVENVRVTFPHLSVKQVAAVGEDASVLDAIATYCVAAQASKC
jgi:sirohydrochlorin cobaltochelatase